MIQASVITTISANKQQNAGVKSIKQNGAPKIENIASFQFLALYSNSYHWKQMLYIQG